MPIDQSTEPYRVNGTSATSGRSIQEKFGGVLSFFAAATLYALLFTVLYSPVIFTDHVICAEVQSINALLGERCLWTLAIYGGFPFAVDPGAQYFYPISRLFGAISGSWSWNAYIIFAYTFSAAFCFSYVRLLTNSNFAAFIASFAFAFGFLPTQIAHYHILHTSIWLVAGLLAFELLARKESGVVFACGATAIGIAGLAGHPQIFAYALGLWTLYVIARAPMLSTKADKLRYLAQSFLMITLGGLIAGLQLFQTMALASVSARAKFSFDDFLTYAVNPIQSVGCFFPFIFGGAPDGIISQPRFGNFLAWTQDVYYGIAIMFLSLSMVFAFRTNRMVLFWAFIGITTLLLSFGNATPLAWLFYNIPPYGRFRALHRILELSSLANAVLAGLCVAMIEKRLLPQKILPKVIVVLSAIFITLLGIISTFAELLQTQAHKFGIEHLGVLPWTNPTLGIPCLVLLASIASCLFYEKYPGKASRIALALTLMCDLGFTAWYSLSAEWRIGEPSYNDLKEPVTAQKYTPLAKAHMNRILTVRGGSSTFDELKPNMSQLWHVPQASGYGPLMPVRYGELFNMTEGGFLLPPWHYQPEDRCFDILSIKYAMAARDDNRLEAIVGKAGPNWRKLEELGTASVHENLRLLPHCWLVNQVLQLPGPEILNAIKTSRLKDKTPFDPLKTALVDEMPPGDWSKNDTDNVNISGQAKISLYTAELIRLETQTKTKAFLVLSDIYFPAWQAKIDGVATPIFCTDYVLRGISLPPGHHQIEFAYGLATIHLSEAIAGISFLMVLAVAFYIERRVERRVERGVKGRKGESLIDESSV